MLDASLIFKMGAMGILTVVLDQVLASSGKKDLSLLISWGTAIIFLIVILYKLANVFGAVKTLFTL